MSVELARLVQAHQRTGTFSDGDSNEFARVILSIMPGFLLNLAMIGPAGVSGFPAAVRELWPAR